MKIRPKSATLEAFEVNDENLVAICRKLGQPVAVTYQSTIEGGYSGNDFTAKRIIELQLDWGPTTLDGREFTAHEGMFIVFEEGYLPKVLDRPSFRAKYEVQPEVEPEVQPITSPQIYTNPLRPFPPPPRPLWDVRHGGMMRGAAAGPFSPGDRGDAQ